MRRVNYFPRVDDGDIGSGRRVRMNLRIQQNLQKSNAGEDFCFRKGTTLTEVVRNRYFVGSELYNVFYYNSTNALITPVAGFSNAGNFSGRVSNGIRCVIYFNGSTRPCLME